MRTYIALKNTTHNVIVLSVAAILLSACVVEPYPGPPPVAAAPYPGPPPVAYAAPVPCCYSYYEYPPAYYYGYGGPSVDFSFGGHGGRRWR